MTRKYILLFFGIAFLGTSCFNDLDTIPIDPDEVTAANVYDDPSAYKGVLAKLYAGLALTGQRGPDGAADISGIDEGFGQYLRALWYHQELPTDEAVIGWADQTIADFHEQDWTTSDNFIFAFYSRIFYQVSVCNEFIRETTEDKLNSRNVDDALRAEIQIYRAEARFLRALSYWHALDHFRNVPFVTEEDQVEAFFPEQTNAVDLYNYIEAELRDIENLLLAPRANEYARADQAAAWMLLAKLYLNAEVYVNKNAYSDCIEYCNKIINAGYTLEEEYQHLFLADNHNSDEIIFPVAFDGQNTRTFGGTNFIIRAGVGGNMDAVSIGVDNGWGGTRSTSALVNKFPFVVGATGGGAIVSPQTSEEHPEIFVPGSYVSWSFADALPLASAEDDGVYEGYLYLPAGAQFKITLERNFTTNYGDDDLDGTLDANGDNLTVSEEGFYRVFVDLNDLSYAVDKTTWGIIGSATENGWDSDQDMTFNPDNNAWEITTILSEGEMKFRANDDWAINYGDIGANGLLDFDGSNIIIPRPGTYTIQLLLSKPDHTYSIESNTADSRALFHTDGQTLEIEDIAEFTNGYPSTKFKNVTSTGELGSDFGFVDTDFPMFRLADTYLMYAEAVLRGGSGGDLGTALDLVNQVRFRAYQEAAGNIDQDDLTLDFILDERARELHWECHRRTDLVRFGQFTDGSYLWPWKGGVPDGQPVSNHFNVFPIPAADIGANPNLEQNDGY